MIVNNPEKIEWQGAIVSIQPRTTVWRYRLDNRTHYHRGYNLFLDGEANGIRTKFSVAISEKQQRKLIFRIGDVAKGSAWTKMYEVSDYGPQENCVTIILRLRGYWSSMIRLLSQKTETVQLY